MTKPQAFKATVRGAARFQVYGKDGEAARPYMLLNLTDIVHADTGEAIIGVDGEPLPSDHRMTCWINTDSSRNITAEDGTSIVMDNVFPSGQCAGAMNMKSLGEMCGEKAPSELTDVVTTANGKRVKQTAMNAVCDVMCDFEKKLETGGKLAKVDGFVGVGTLSEMTLNGVKTLRPNSFAAFVDADATASARRR
jgi:hypothetical protein